VYASLPGAKYISLGGGAASGSWTSAAVQAVTTAINGNKFSAYSGIVYDIEEGTTGLAQAFAASFAAAKAKGLKVMVTISHSAPYGIKDAATLMNSFFPNSNIDYISPQLYTTGTEKVNDFTANGGVPWSAYASSNCKAKVVPSIPAASMYSNAKTTFASFGVQTAGFIQWQQA
jgi:hypothetical protein